MNNHTNCDNRFYYYNLPVPSQFRVDCIESYLQFNWNDNFDTPNNNLTFELWQSINDQPFTFVTEIDLTTYNYTNFPNNVNLKFKLRSKNIYGFVSEFTEIIEVLGLPFYIASVLPRHIEYVCNNYQLGFDAANVFFSSDSGVTWTVKAFADANKIESGYIFDNGNLFFTARNAIYKSTDGLVTIVAVIPKDLLGFNYIPHVPVNPNFPGYYYRCWERIKKSYIAGNELAIWGNYGNSYMGANPTNIYSCDNLCNVTVIYQFGQNPNYTDNGTATGGIGGLLLGDPANPIITKHVHSTGYDSVNNFFYTSTGDNPITSENHILKGQLVGAVWTWNVIYTAIGYDRWWLVGLNIINQIIYWGIEAQLSPLNHKIIKCNIANILIPANHTAYFNNTDVLNLTDIETYDLIIDTIDGIGVITFDQSVLLKYAV